MTASATTPAPAVSDSTRHASSGLTGRDALVIVGLAVLTVVVFANGLTGEFVLDDHKQIVRNDLIQSPRFWRQALTHDVWAFTGEGDVARSNYWRPGHVAWLIVNYQLFGARPLGWHVTNLLAHLGVVASAYVLLRWLGASVAIAGAIVAIFAIHPTRAESVTWISGAHDVLASLWQILALLCLTSIWRRDVSGAPLGGAGRAIRWAAAVVLYVLAVTTKEIAVFFPVIVALVRYTEGSGAALENEHDRRLRLHRALWAAAPFAALAVAYLVARWLILGSTQLRFPWQPPWQTVITSLPLVICTYLRQIVFPYWIGWSYPVRVVTSANFGLWTFFVPLLILVAVVAVAQQLVRGRLAVIGAALFVLTLLPALNLKAFLPEQIVKDRYLYLPLLGFLMIAVPAIARLAPRLPASARAHARVIGGQLLAVVVLLLSVRTMSYNRAWRAEVPLWEWAVRSDPGAATSHQGLGTAYMLAGRLEDAWASLDRSLAIHQTADALGARAEVLLRLREYKLAEADCKRLLDSQPDNFRALERLAIAYERQGRHDEAAETLRNARQKVPYRYAVFSDSLSVVLYNQGKKDEALRELEGAREAAERDFTPGSRLALFHLGALYDEMGRRADAVQVLNRFMELTESSSDPNVLAGRRRAVSLLRSPSGGGGGATPLPATTGPR